ncbi:MAG: DUF3048 domain-containing protein [Candidatus Aquicultorales bacterium]
MLTYSAAHLILTPMQIGRYKLPRNQAIAAIVFLAVLLVGTTAAAIFIFGSSEPKPVAKAKGKARPVKQAVAPEPAPQYFDALSGLSTTAELAARRPIAVMVENLYPDARPQTGLDKASVVFETLAEGGITRFMALYHTGDAEVLGPIRSAREYYVNMVKGFDAVYIHVGASDGGYRAIQDLGVNDIDQIYWSPGFWRTSDRDAPHNLYGSTVNLREQAAVKGYAVNSQAPGFDFKDDVDKAQRPDGQAFSVDFSYPEYRVKYVYQKDSNSYLRYMGGQPHVDAVSGSQLLVKNVAVMYTSIDALNDGYNRIGVGTTGSGSAVVMQDGKAVEATWKRPGSNDMIRFYDASGAEIKLNRGQTWIEATDRPVINEQ